MVDEGEPADAQQLSLDFPMFQKWHHFMTANLTDRDKIFERHSIGLSLLDADKIYAVTGCRRLEEYVVRMALNDAVFSSLL